jgi:hypothetical protein
MHKRTKEAAAERAVTEGYTFLETRDHEHALESFRRATELYGQLGDRTLELLHTDMVAKLARGINVSEEVYEFLAKESGYASLQEAERRLGERRGSARPA